MVLPDRYTLYLPTERETADMAQGSVQFIGTATVLLRYAGFTILTDPNFLHQGELAHLGYGIYTTRQTNPALELHQLPPIDFVLLSHFHEDHFDRRVVRELDRAIPIITTPQAALALRRRCFAATQALATWETLTLHKGLSMLRVTSLPARHGPALIWRALPQTMGSMLEFMDQDGQVLLRVYISGDTLWYAQLQTIAQHYPHIDLALLHLGGTRLMGILVTMDARQGLEALESINAHKTIPIHYNDYDSFKSPLHHFEQLVTLSGLQARVVYLHHGDKYTFEVLEKQER